MEPQQIALARIAQAFQCFATIAQNPQPLVACTDGISHLWIASRAVEDLRSLEAPEAHFIYDVIFAAAPLVSEAVSSKISQDEIYFGLGCAAALVTAQDLDYVADRQSHARILAAKIEMFLEYRALDERGAPLTRALLIKRAMSAPPEPGVRLN